MPLARLKSVVSNSQMQDSSSTNQTSKIKRNTILFLIAVIFLVIALCYSILTSSPKIIVNKENPPTFYMSGDNRVIFFQVSNDSGPVWKIYPAGSRFSLSDIRAIKYGEVPSSWTQEIPLNSAPLPLGEGKEYQAFAVIFDSDVVRVNFTIKDGKVAGLSKVH